MVLIYNVYIIRIRWYRYNRRSSTHIQQQSLIDTKKPHREGFFYLELIRGKSRVNHYQRILSSYQYIPGPYQYFYCSYQKLSNPYQHIQHSYQ